jgi:hypothetical protein
VSYEKSAVIVETDALIAPLVPAFMLGEPPVRVRENPVQGFFSRLFR